MLHTFALAAAAAALVLPLPAHATIVGSTPEDGATITTLPESFAVTANEEILDVEGSSSNVVLLTDQDGRYYGDGCASVDGATLSTVAELGEPGVYTMRYGLVSADGHPIEGAVTFAWEPEGDVEAATGLDEAPVCGEAAPTSSPSASATGEPSTSAQPSATTEPPSSSTAPSTPADGASDGDGGLSPIALVGIGLAALAAIATVVVIVVRRGRGA